MLYKSLLLTKIAPAFLILVLIFSCLFMFGLFKKSQKYEINEKNSSIWNNIENTTFKKDNDWAGEGYVFYVDDKGQKRSIHQIYGSGVYVVSSEYAEVNIIDEEKIKIGNDIYEYKDGKLISNNNTLSIFEKRPLVYNREGLIDILIVKRNDFDIRNLKNK